MKKLQLRLLSVLCLAALLIACLPAAYAYGVCSAWAKPELDQMSELSLIPQVLEEKPNLWDSITRLEMCAIAVQAYEVYTGEEIPLPEEAPFSDTQDPIAGKAYAAGLTQGYEDGTFRPDRLFDPAGVLCVCGSLFPRLRAGPGGDRFVRSERVFRCLRRRRLGSGGHQMDGAPGGGSGKRRKAEPLGQRHL